MATLLMKAIRGELLKEDKASLSEMIKCITSIPTSDDILATFKKNTSFTVRFDFDMGNILFDNQDPSSFSSAFIATIRGMYLDRMVTGSLVLSTNTGLPTDIDHATLELDVNCLKEIEYDGFKTTEEAVEIISRASVPTGETIDGVPQFIEKEVPQVVMVPKRVTVKKKKKVLDPDFRTVTLPSFIETTHSLLVDYIWDELTNIGKIHPFGAPSRPPIAVDDIEVVSKWSEQENGMSTTISDKSWASMGFDLALFADQSLTPVVNSTASALNGFTPAYPSYSSSNGQIIFGVRLTMCQVTGSIIPKSRMKETRLYSTTNIVVMDKDVFKIIQPFLVTHMVGVVPSARGGFGIYEVNLLNIDKRAYKVDAGSCFEMTYGYNLVSGSWSRFLNGMETSEFSVFPMAIFQNGYTNGSGTKISDMLKAGGLEKVGIPNHRGMLTEIKADGSITVKLDNQLPSPKQFLPKPRHGSGLGDLHFPSGWEPPKALGFKRDSHPTASVQPKPNYRYYGMEIEIENPTGLVTSDHVTGFIAPNVYKKGFTYGTDASIRNGLEFRSNPQGFRSLSENLRGLFSLLNTPLPRNFSCYSIVEGSQSADPYNSNDFIWDINEGRWKENTSKQPLDKKKDEILVNQWKTSERCGLHIHVSRDSLTELQLGKVLAFVYSKKNKSFMTSIAGRTNEKYAEMTSAPPFEVTDDGKIKTTKTDTIGRRKVVRDFVDPKTGKVLKSFEVTRFHKHRWEREGRGGDFDKYTAVNTLHADTIEFRMFKGVDNADEAITKLQFIDSLLEFTSPNSPRPVSIADCVSKDKYIEWLFSDPDNHKKYALLITYIKGIDKASVDKVAKPKDLETMTRRAATKQELMALFA